MKKLEQIIKGNASAFDTEEPSAGHLERFMDKLDKKKPTSKPRRLPPVWHYAAAAVVLIGFGLAFILFAPTAGEANYFSEELLEVENFYTKEINNKLELLSSEKDIASNKEIVAELKQFDEPLTNLKKELSKNPNNTKIKEAMIYHYQLKLEIVDHIINQTITRNI